jgi:glutathionylspermidine synthase
VPEKDEEDDEDMKYLAEIVKQAQLEKEMMLGSQNIGLAKGGLSFIFEPSIFGMDRKLYSYKREMKQLFSDSAS